MNTIEITLEFAYFRGQSPNKIIQKFGEPLQLVVRYKNTTSKRLRLLRAYTPLEGILGNLFTVKNNGKDVKYIGPLCKRIAPTIESFKTVLEPYETIIHVFELSEYQFTLGKHTLRLTRGVNFIEDGETDVEKAVYQPCKTKKLTVVFVNETN